MDLDGWVNSWMDGGLDAVCPSCNYRVLVSRVSRNASWLDFDGDGDGNGDGEIT